MMSLVWPGLGQIVQGRFALGLYFVVEALVVATLFLASQSLRIPMGIALIVIALWSAIDAYLAA